MAKYERKPPVIDAIKYTGENLKEIIDFSEGKVCFIDINNRKDKKLICKSTEVDWHKVEENDYIVKDEDNNIFPMFADVFERRYTPVEEQISIKTEDKNVSFFDLNFPI